MGDASQQAVAAASATVPPNADAPSLKAPVATEAAAGAAASEAPAGSAPPADEPATGVGSQQDATVADQAASPQALAGGVARGDSAGAGAVAQPADASAPAPVAAAPPPPAGTPADGGAPSDSTAVAGTADEVGAVESDAGEAPTVSSGAAGEAGGAPDSVSRDASQDGSVGAGAGSGAGAGAGSGAGSRAAAPCTPGGDVSRDRSSSSASRGRSSSTSRDRSCSTSSVPGVVRSSSGKPPMSARKPKRALDMHLATSNADSEDEGSEVPAGAMTPMTRITNMSASPLLNSPRRPQVQQDEKKARDEPVAMAREPPHRRHTRSKPTKGTKPKSLTPADFLFGPVLGEGAYARVLFCRMKRTKLDYAVKVMLMSFIQKEKKVPFVLTEKRIQSGLSHPNIVKLKYAFKDKQYLYMVLDLCVTELLGVIRTHREANEAKGLRDKALSLDAARWYVAQIVAALEYLHLEKHVVHRDLKPENILITADGQVQITDFGTAKDKHVPKELLTAFVGTAEYVSPEVLADDEATRAVDLWALGCITFQLLVGRPPFRGGSEYLTFQQIMHYPDSHALEYPMGFPQVARDFMEALLKQNPRARLGGGEDGASSYAELKAHPFFGSGEGAFEAVRAAAPPYVPPKQAEPKLVDGAVPDWDQLGDATCLSMGVNRERSVRDIIVAGELAGAGAASNGAFKPPPGAQVPVVPAEGAYWAQHLEPHERVLHSGLVEKRVGLFARKRQLLLTTKPRLIYFDPAKFVLKGEIPWGPTLRVQVKDRRTFDIHVPGRVYHLTEVLGTAAVWRDAIEGLMAATSQAT